MTDSQKLQNEINALNAKRNAVINENTVSCNAPAIKRTFTYRSSPAIKASDLV